MTADKKIMQFPEKSPYDCSMLQGYTSCKLPSGAPDWLKEQRLKAFGRFKQQGLPTPKLERFKYTNIAKFVEQWDGVLGDCKIDVQNAGNFSKPLLSAFDVDWVQELIKQEAPGAEKYGDSALWDLNTAYLKEGTVIDVPAGEIIAQPIYLNVIAQDDSYSSVRDIVRIGDNAEVTIIEDHSGEGEYWKNFSTHIVLGKNAKLHHIRIQNDSQAAVYTQFTKVTLDQDATYNGYSFNIGAAQSRHQAHVELIGKNGHASFDGLNLLADEQLADTTILVEHQAAHCTSNQFYRSLVNDTAQCIFQGKVHVYEDAQKTDGYQLSNALLLSDKAQMHTKPELEIYADDVQCSHGATTGQLEEEPLFYLRSRGLSEAQARLLLVEAFVNEIVDKIDNTDIHEHIHKSVQEWLINNIQ